ncbi:hypothetical protein DFH09DRAFT_1450411 [Mycena vulgaris]|nr:hypothetical protein DFH09DRAFT_1450411 [Mycena vulgaris]
MAANPNTNMLIVLGSDPDSYLIGHGRGHFVQNMPESFTKHAKTDLNIAMTLWIRYIRYLHFHFNGNIHSDIHDHLSGKNGKASTEFISFPNTENPDHYFVKGKNIPNFDTGLTGIIFGKGKTHIYLFRGGFMADLDDDDVASEDHPLYKVFMLYDEGWCIERGSTLCLYDSRFYFLKFGQSGTKIHWNLPPQMDVKLRELQAIAKQPEEQTALMQKDQKWTDVGKMRLNNELQMNRVLYNQIQREGVEIPAMASQTPVRIVERYY